MFRKKITTIIKDTLKDYIHQGDICLDLTLGNGNDTLFMRELVGESGQVYGFDIQEVALEKSKELLIKNNCFKSCSLIKDSHENVKDYINGEVAVAMMNLGYLPQGDKKIITKASSSVKAIEETLHLLKKQGVLSLVIYYGHKGGQEEKEEVTKYLSNLDPKKYEVITIQYTNRTNAAPIMNFVYKMND